MCPHLCVLLTFNMLIFIHYFNRTLFTSPLNFHFYRLIQPAEAGVVGLLINWNNLIGLVEKCILNGA